MIRLDRPAEFRQAMRAEQPDEPDGFYIAGGVVTRMNGQEDLIPLDIPYEEIRRIESLHTVGELRDMADWLRDAPSRVKQMEPRDMLSDLRTQNEDFVKWDRFASTFGFGGETIRDTIH